MTDTVNYLCGYIRKCLVSLQPGGMTHHTWEDIQFDYELVAEAEGMLSLSLSSARTDISLSVIIQAMALSGWRRR